MIRRNHSVSRTCRLLCVARSRVNVLLKRTDDWKDRRLACNRPTHLLQDDGLQEEIQEALVRHPSFGYKRDYLLFIDFESAETALGSLPGVIKLYNEEHPHSALGYLSPMEYRKAKALSEPEPRQVEPIRLIPGFMLTQEVNSLEEHRVNVW